MNLVHSIKRELTALWGDGLGKSLVVIATGWGLLLGTRMVYPMLLPHFRESFDLSLAVAGLLVTILWLGSAVGQLPGGILADRYGERRCLSAGALSVAVALVFVVTAPSAVVLFVATGVIGLGQSLYPIARITILSKLYPDRLGSALGATMATGDLGQMLLPPIAGALAATFMWQVGLAVLIPPIVLLGLLLWLVLPAQSGADSAVDALSTDTVRYVLAELRRPNMVFMSSLLFLYILVWQSFTGFYPTYLIEVKGLPVSRAALLFSLFFAIGVVVKPLAGAAYDRIGFRGSLIGVLVGPFVGFLALPSADSLWALVVVTALISTMLGSGAITQSFLAESFAEDMRGTGLGAVRTMAATLGAAGPVLFGIVADRGYFDEGYLLLAAILSAVILLTFRISRP